MYFPDWYSIRLLKKASRYLVVAPQIKLLTQSFTLRYCGAITKFFAFGYCTPDLTLNINAVIGLHIHFSHMRLQTRVNFTLGAHYFNFLMTMMHPPEIHHDSVLQEAFANL